MYGAKLSEPIECPWRFVLDVFYARNGPAIFDTVIKRDPWHITVGRF